MVLADHFGLKLQTLWSLKPMLLRRVMSYIKLLTLGVTMTTCSKLLNWYASILCETSILLFSLYSLISLSSKSKQVHQSSTDAASSLLVTALNKGRDVIMDGTLSWEPFVEQTIAMARNIHKYRYRMGVGYRKAQDGTITENYWEQVNEAEEEHELKENYKRELHTRKPYKIVLVGVVCDGYLAVVRGIRY